MPLGARHLAFLLLVRQMYRLLLASKCEALQLTGGFARGETSWEGAR
jgi:hypothetical protein